MNALQIARDAKLTIEAHAVQTYPAECCGILVGMQGGVMRVVPANNIAEPARLHDRYVVDPLAILQTDKVARDDGMEILGFYHSHPDHAPVPSVTDLQMAWTGYVYIIVSVSLEAAGLMQAWRLAETGRMEQLEILET